MASNPATVGIVAALLAPAVAVSRAVQRHRLAGTSAERAAYAAMHAVALAGPPLRVGLTPDSTRRAARHLRPLLGTAALAFNDTERTLTWDGAGQHRHSQDSYELSTEALKSGTVRVLGPEEVHCGSDSCMIRHAVVAPIIPPSSIGGIRDGSSTAIGTLSVYSSNTSVALVRAVGEVAYWVATQIELAELDRSRTRLMETELRALRAQISPHFIYNSLTAIASFTRTDPERARGLLMEFADFTRYSFRAHGEFTTLAEELRCVDRYLLLERARFGERLQVSLRIAPEVLPVEVPFLCVQPIVENAVRHGLEGKPGPGHVTITAEPTRHHYRITVADDGVGITPDVLHEALAPAEPGTRTSVGLSNVHERLRAVYGTAYGLAIESEPGAGTTVVIRIPKK
ncbi:sensor histidine kinase [Catenulispora sp. GAS73]|uniref:sensor histidine kinase n=1 Tax=Catenulispora sp. GAS73 TaxID=3156269 RepID=UPI003517DBD6